MVYVANTFTLTLTGGLCHGHGVAPHPCYSITSGTVSVIDGKTNTVTANVKPTNIKVGVSLLAISVNPSTNMIYVSYTPTHTHPAISVIDGKTNTLVAEIKVGILNWAGTSCLQTYQSIHQLT